MTATQNRASRPLTALVASQNKPPKHLRLSPVEAAAYLGIKPRTLKKWRHERRVPFYRLGHVAVVFNVSDLDAFLARRRVEAIG